MDCTCLKYESNLSVPVSWDTETSFSSNLTCSSTHTPANFSYIDGNLHEGNMTYIYDLLHFRSG